MKFVRHLHPFGYQGIAKGTKVHGFTQEQGAIDIPQHGTKRMLSWPNSAWMFVCHRISSIVDWD
jgi:hypothetical protein